jgi:hypothetical protein
MNISQELRQEWLDLTAALESGGGVRPGPVSAVALFAEIEDVLAVFDELRSSGLLERFADRYVTSSWTLRQLLAHMASWAGEFRREVETAARGEAFDYTIPFAGSVYGPTQWNQREVETRKGRPVLDLVAEFESESRRLQDFTLGLNVQELNAQREFPLSPAGDPHGRMQGSLARTTLVKCGHDRMHLARIREWLDLLADARS